MTMNRLPYEAPMTERFQVELEGAFMGASIAFKELETMQAVDITAQGQDVVGNDEGWGEFNDNFKTEGWE